MCATLQYYCHVCINSNIHYYILMRMQLLQCITRMDCTLQRLEALQPATISQEHMGMCIIIVIITTLNINFCCLCLIIMYIGELLQSIQQTFKDCTEVISERQCIL